MWRQFKRDLMPRANAFQTDAWSFVFIWEAYKNYKLNENVLIDACIWWQLSFNIFILIYANYYFFIYYYFECQTVECHMQPSLLFLHMSWTSIFISQLWLINALCLDFVRCLHPIFYVHIPFYTNTLKFLLFSFSFLAQSAVYSFSLFVENSVTTSLFFYTFTSHCRSKINFN